MNQFIINTKSIHGKYLGVLRRLRLIDIGKFESTDEAGRHGRQFFYVVETGSGEDVVRIPRVIP
jgi:hypothetical protein